MYIHILYCCIGIWGNLFNQLFQVWSCGEGEGNDESTCRGRFRGLMSKLLQLALEF